MKLKFHCGKCPQLHNPSPFKIEFPISDELYYTFTCDKGHLNRYSVANTRYGLLFESGLYAFLDGYNREAVSSCYVALERFYEYVITLFLANDSNFSFEDINSLKKTTYLSERTYGAFCTVYLMKFKKPLVPFDNKEFLKEINVSFPGFENSPVKFRNKIIHEGYIPTQEETLSYAKAVGKFILKITNEIIEASPNALLDFSFLVLNNKRKQGEENSNHEVSNMVFPTFLGNIMIRSKHDFDIEKHLEFVKQDRAR